ncbi:MAG TPA: PilZ domain-containing protein [Myxococcota bacterium]|nr:PilZ domain-containing protein [Myxococcota bacterium]
MTSNGRSSPPGGPGDKRTDPRMAISIGIEVEVAGERRRVSLVSRDISPGGIFLRTEAPAPIFKRVTLFLPQPGGTQLVLGGEVVRSLSPEQARAKGQPAGMAVAFDEASRPKTKQLLALVERMAQGEARPPAAAREPPPAPATARAPEAAAKSDVEAKADSLLGELDALLKGDEAPGPADVELDVVVDGPPVDVEPEVTDASGRLRALAHEETPRPPAPAARPAEAPARRPASSTAMLPPAQAAAHVAELQAALAAYRQAVKGSTHYEVLLLTRQARAEQIRQAFGQLLQRLKPRAPSSQLPPELARGLAQALDRIKKASDTLTHPERRKAYDFLLQADNGS